MKQIVLKIGGSLLYDTQLHLKEAFLLLLKEWYNKNKKSYSKIVITVGGGKLSRFIGGQVTNLFSDPNYVHGLAMQGTQLNAQILKGMLMGPSDDIKSPETLGSAIEMLMDSQVHTIITGGVREGWSTDMDAAVFADILGLDRVYKLSNIDYIYDSDPKLNVKAKPIYDLTWNRYFKLFNIVDSTSHAPNASLPIDEVCAKFAKNKGLSFFVSGGESIEKNECLESIFESGTFVH